MEVLFPLLVFAVLGGVVLYLGTLSLAPEERAWAFRILLLAMAVRLLLATAFALFPEVRFFHEDADGYEIIGMQLAAGWSGHGPPLRLEEGMPNLGQFYLCGGLYYLFGAFRAVPSYFNSILGAFTVLVVYRLTRRCFHIAVARRAALLVALMPSIIMWNALALKDTAVTLLVVIALSSCVDLKRRFSAASMLGILLPVIALQPLRFYMVYFVLLAVVGSLFLERGGKVLTGVPKSLAIAGGLILLLVAVGLSGRAQEGTQFFDLQRVNAYRQGMAATANSAFASDADVSTPGRAIAFLPIGLAVLLFGPFPWQMTSLRPILAAPETILWWAMVPAAIRGLRYAAKRRFSDTSPIFLFAFTLAPAYALVQGNVGSAFRQRAQIFVLLFMFVALGQYVQRCRQLGIDDSRLLSDPPAPAAPADQKEAA
jgi:hypothetical protein